MHIVYIVHYC